MKLFYDERDFIVTESELKESYDDLIKNNEFCGSFDDYIKECCGKNGTLTPILKN